MISLVCRHQSLGTTNAEAFAAGPSATPNSCPKFTPLGTFRDNVAHRCSMARTQCHCNLFSCLKSLGDSERCAGQLLEISAQANLPACCHPLYLSDPACCSNLFYGLRIHPEFYPSSSFCGVSAASMVPAVFQGLTAYKNGVKGVVATQVGLVQFHNFSLAGEMGRQQFGPRRAAVGG